VDVPFGLLQLHLASSLQRQRLLKAWNRRHGIVALVMSGRPVLTLRKTLWRSIRKKRKTEHTQEPVATMLNIPQPTRTAAAQPRHDVRSREHLQGLEPHVRRLLGVLQGVHSFTRRRVSTSIAARAGISTSTTTMAQTTLDEWASDPVNPEVRAHVYSLISAVGTPIHHHDCH
jgi:hypothetical protein